MTPTIIKTIAFLVGSLCAALSMVPKFSPYAGALGSFGGTLVGWSGLRRPGDSAPEAGKP